MADKTKSVIVRMTPDQKAKLDDLAKDSTMSSVLLHGLELEWDFKKGIGEMMDAMPRLPDADAVEKWCLARFNNQPELMDKMVRAGTLKTYIEKQKHLQQATEIDTMMMEAIGYQIQKIGVNINQIAKVAHQNQAIDLNELKQFTRSIIHLQHAVVHLHTQNLKGGDQHVSQG